MAYAPACEERAHSPCAAFRPGRGVRAVRTVLLAAGFLLSALAAATAPVHAEQETKKDGIDYRKPFIYDAVDPAAYSDPRLLRKKLESDELTPRERAELLRLIAQLEVELGNFKQAIRDVEASFETGALTDIEEQENYFFLGRLYLGIEPPDYDKGIENLRKFIGVAKNPDPDAFFYLGQALAMTGQYKKAIPQAEKAIALSKTPKENHYRLLLFCHLELKDYKRVAALTEEVLTLFAVKDEYLSQLAGAYEELGRSRDAFLVQAFRYELGLLDSEAELVSMADLYLFYRNPHRAARILEKEMKAGRVSRTQKNMAKLGNMYFLAREYAEARRWLLEAANFGREGEPADPLRACRNDEDWDCAERVLRETLKKGKSKRPCRLHFLLGHTLNNKDDRAGAIEQFELAAQSPACRNEASQWVDYLKQQAAIDALPHRDPALIAQVKALYTLVEDAAVAVSPDEDAHEAAKEALHAARQARSAASREARRRNLSGYERMSRLAQRHLKDGALERARADYKQARRLRAQLPKDRLEPASLRKLELLDKLTRRRVTLLEEAQANLEEAEEIAAQVRERE